jgi:putative transcriptional regulator
MEKHKTLDVVSNKVNYFRKEKNVTQEELAKSVGVSRQTIIALEKGNYSPSICLALKISKFFGVCVDDIFCVE